MPMGREGAAPRHRWHEDERGATVLELLTGLMLFAMVAAILYSFMLLGVSMYKKVSVDTRMQNQADTLYIRILSELKGAVYVRQGGSDKEIVFVKPASDAASYVDIYRMAIEPDGLDGPYGISVYEPGASAPRRYELGGGFAFRQAASALTAADGHAVDIRLSFGYSGDTPAQEAAMEIHSTIPLIRTE